MKNFHHLTVGETKNLSEEDIKIYALDVGEEMLDDLNVRRVVAIQLGTGKIRRQIEKLKQLDKDLAGE